MTIDEIYENERQVALKEVEERFLEYKKNPCELTLQEYCHSVNKALCQNTNDINKVHSRVSIRKVDIANIRQAEIKHNEIISVLSERSIEHDKKIEEQSKKLNETNEKIERNLTDIRTQNSKLFKIVTLSCIVSVLTGGDFFNWIRMFLNIG